MFEIMLIGKPNPSSYDAKTNPGWVSFTMTVFCRWNENPTTMNFVVWMRPSESDYVQKRVEKGYSIMVRATSITFRDDPALPGDTIPHVLANSVVGI